MYLKKLKVFKMKFLTKPLVGGIEFVGTNSQKIADISQRKRGLNYN